MTDPGSGEGPDSRVRAATEVALSTAVYLGIALGAVRWIDVSGAMTWLTPPEADVVSGFMVGSLSQISAILLIWLILRPVDLEAAFRSLGVDARPEGWSIALAVVVVETVVMFTFFIDVGWRALEPSRLNLTGSLAPLLDGVVQEIFFRGYLILRLARAGYGPWAQLLWSSLAFSAIHVGYLGDTWASALPPLLGTMGLGLALGWAFIRGGYSLRPAIAAHATILLIVQPWLALAR